MVERYHDFFYYRRVPLNQKHIILDQTEMIFLCPEIKKVISKYRSSNLSTLSSTYCYRLHVSNTYPIRENSDTLQTAHT